MRARSFLSFFAVAALLAGCTPDLQHELPGAIWTTGPAAAHNVYEHRLDVRLGGGAAPDGSGTLPDGRYVVGVTDASGDVLLSRIREIEVDGGAPEPISLAPFADSRDGVYKVWITRASHYPSNEKGTRASGFAPLQSRTETFRVRTFCRPAYEDDEDDHDQGLGNDDGEGGNEDDGNGAGEGEEEGDGDENGDGCPDEGDEEDPSDEPSDEAPGDADVPEDEPSDDADGNGCGDEYGARYGDTFGDIVGDVWGDHYGDWFGDLHGNHYGDRFGDTFGDIHGNVYGDVYGDWFGDLHGSHYGQHFGDRFGDTYGSIGGAGACGG